jgi:hypothetical protein
MKLYIDLATRRFVRGQGGTSTALSRLTFKRRDVIALDIDFLQRGEVVPTPAGTTITAALKSKFSDGEFLALADSAGTLDLYTQPVEDLFVGNTASVSALIEVKWSAPGEAMRTATLAVDLQNSVILGDEGIPASVPSLKATLAEAAAGTSNEKWTTPLRVWDAIRAWAAANFTWANLAGKPATFPPSPHTHTASQITDFAAAVQAVSPSEPAPTTPANSGIAISGNSLATAYNTTVADGVVSVSVGGAPAAPASSWKSKNLVQVLDDILFPTILASVGTAKSISLAVSGVSGVLEVGSSIARTLTATFTRGTILDGNGSTNANPLVGDATGYTFTGTGITSTTQPGNTLAFTTAVVSGSNNWAVTAAHAAGTGSYFDNKSVAGTNLATSRAAGTATDSTSAPTITGVHPYYFLKSSSPISAAAMVTAIQNGTATKVIADSTGTLTIPYAPSAQYLAVAYPSTSTTKTRYFVTALDNGAITVVFNAVATLSVTTALWSQSYKIHTSAGALTNSAANIELRNT